jgi:hypothetical protein
MTSVINSETIDVYLQHMNNLVNEVCRTTRNTFTKYVLQIDVHHSIPEKK